MEKSNVRVLGVKLLKSGESGVELSLKESGTVRSEDSKEMVGEMVEGEREKLRGRLHLHKELTKTQKLKWRK